MLVPNSPIWMAGPARLDDGTSAVLPPGRRWDVVVVGAGLVGLLVAGEMARRGTSVAVLEADRVGGRSSGQGMGIVAPLHADRYDGLRRRHGIDVARAAAQWSRRGVDLVGRAVQEGGISCGWTPATMYACATSSAGAATVDAEAEAAEACGLPVFASVADDLPFRTTAALGIEESAHLDPFALCTGLAASLVGRGVPIVEGTRVLAIEEDRHGVHLTLAAGTVSAEHVVIATQFPIAGPARLVAGIIPTRERVVAGRCSTFAGLLRGMYSAVDDEGWSVRPRSGAGDGWSVLSGGTMHLRDEPDVLSQHQRAQVLAERRLAMDVRGAWSLTGSTTADGLPCVGPMRPGSACTVATGMGPWGPAGAAAAAEMIAVGVHGEAAPFAAALTPGRPSAVQRARPAREAWGRLRRSIAVASLPPLPTLPLPPGSGMVARRGANPVAMSCDLDGTTTMLSARCGHAGCVVRFNDAELNWECACHGSRFGLDGAVLDGPATRPLAPYHLGA